ncbi:NUDIX domain [Seminavis robusta]|uniref:NUDIX domain n=1 Tax=Seminavis robusta TaxID=568900 RepID=A0A9N8D924_9STRA|nr:NUDIX domain [Seminavis robusta]|eukprot:Sro20_g013850.1 NUDIX domain (268) ;mRNA; r:15215-16018
MVVPSIAVRRLLSVLFVSITFLSMSHHLVVAFQSPATLLRRTSTFSGSFLRHCRARRLVPFMASSSSFSSKTPVPRAAVSTVVRYHESSSSTTTRSSPPKYLLIERGNPPNKGVWCVPGGKIDLGETTLEAAQRELREEVIFTITSSKVPTIAWYAGGPFCTSDSILPGISDDVKGFHYVIGQCFAEIIVSTTDDDDDDDDDDSSFGPPLVEPADDAAAAAWWTLDEIRTAEAKKETVPNLVIVIERAEALYQCGMLPTTIPPNKGL